MIVVFDVEKPGDPKNSSQLSIKYVQEPLPSKDFPPSRRSFGRFSPIEPSVRENPLSRRLGGDDRAPLIPNSTSQRQPRSDGVSQAAPLPGYQDPMGRGYPTPKMNRARSEDSGDLGFYVDYPMENDESTPYVIELIWMFHIFLLLPTSCFVENRFALHRLLATMSSFSFINETMLFNI